jgi:hypothetical protein
MSKAVEAEIHVYGRRPLWFDASLLTAALVLVFVATASYASRQINDAASTLTSAWAVAQHGTLDMGISTAPKVWFVPVDGHQFSDRLPGVIAWAVPFYAALGRSEAATSFPAGVAAATATALAMGLLFIAFARLVPRRTAAVAVLLCAFATSSWTVSAHVLWPQGVDQLWLAGMLVAAGSRRWWAVGATSAMAVLTRPPLALASLVMGLGPTLRERRLKPAVVVGGIATLGILALVLYNYFVFGQARLYVGSYALVARSYTGTSDTADASDPIFVLKNLAGALVSPARGVLVISPFLLALVPGLAAAWKAAPGWVRDAALAGALVAVFQFFTIAFSGGSGFYGYRYTIEPLTLCSPLLVLAWHEWTRHGAKRRTCFAVLAGFTHGKGLAPLPAGRVALPRRRGGMGGPGRRGGGDRRGCRHGAATAPNKGQRGNHHGQTGCGRRDRLCELTRRRTSLD